MEAQQWQGPGYTDDVTTGSELLSYRRLEVIGMLRGVGGRGVGDYTSLNKPYLALIMGIKALGGRGRPDPIRPI